MDMDIIRDAADVLGGGTEKEEEKYFILLVKAAERYLQESDSDIGTMLQGLKENLEQ